MDELKQPPICSFFCDPFMGKKKTLCKSNLRLKVSSHDPSTYVFNGLLNHPPAPVPNPTNLASWSNKTPFSIHVAWLGRWQAGKFNANKWQNYLIQILLWEKEFTEEASFFFFFKYFNSVHSYWISRKMLCTVSIQRPISLSSTKPDFCFPGKLPKSGVSPEKHNSFSLSSTFPHHFSFQRKDRFQTHVYPNASSSSASGELMPLLFYVNWRSCTAYNFLFLPRAVVFLSIGFFKGLSSIFLHYGWPSRHVHFLRTFLNL